MKVLNHSYIYNALLTLVSGFVLNSQPLSTKASTTPSTANHPGSFALRGKHENSTARLLNIQFSLICTVLTESIFNAHPYAGSFLPAVAPSI